jgi:DNA-binding transcriptional LysR family regulator
LFELSQLRCFVAAAEELHFGRAAERLYMTQPPLSRQIQILERTLGVQLLQRTSRVVRLTPAGRTFLPEALRILHLAESAAVFTRRTAGPLRTVPAISVVPATADDLLKRSPNKTPKNPTGRADSTIGSRAERRRAKSDAKAAASKGCATFARSV